MSFRGAWTLLRRLWDSPKLIPVLAVMTVLALAGAAFAVFGVLAQDDARERDRVASDLAGCIRGNVLRGQVRAIGEADQDMVQGIIDVVLPAARSERVDEIRGELEPILSRHAAAVAEVALTDCEAVTPGAKTTTPTTEAP